MPLHTLSEDELRMHCKRSIEALELWLRRLIDVRLSEAFGNNYLDSIKSNGDRVVRGEITRKLTEAVAREPSRYARLIDAALLDDEIDIVCNPELYKAHFAPALRATFRTSEDLRAALSRLIPPQNALYHANPISNHDAHRIFCYSLDIIGTLKEYFERRNMRNQFNAPSIIRISDSRGHVRHFTDPNRSGSAMLDLSQEQSGILYCGDRISIEVEVDAAFDPNSYTQRWLLSNIGGEVGTGARVTLDLVERHISMRLCIACQLVSAAVWHRFGTHDDQGEVAYRVLPRP